MGTQQQRSPPTMVNSFIADVSCLRQHPLPLNSIKWLKLKPLLRDWLVNQYNGKLVEAGKDNLSYFISVFTVFDGWIIFDFTPFFAVFQSYQDVARPGIEPRTSDLRVGCPTDCATRPGTFLSSGMEEDRADRSWLDCFRLKYSRLSLSRLRLSRITAYLEVKFWSLF